MWRGALGLVLASVAFGCGPRRPAEAPVLPHEVTVYVAVSDEVAKTDTGNVAAMVDAIEADLRDEGRVVTIVAARKDEPLPVPRLEVQVMGSDSGSATMRGAGKLSDFFVGGVGTALAIAGRGTMLVDAYIVRTGNQPTIYLGRFQASSFGAMSEEAIAAGTSAGHGVARRAIEGAALPPPPTDLGPGQ